MNFYGNRFFAYLLGRFIIKKPRLRKFFTNLLVSDQDIDIELFGAPLRINKRKEIGYLNAYKQAKSSMVFRDESGALINLSLILEPTDTFVDVGANVGLYSSILSKLNYVYPKMKFYAFEAHPETAQRLKQSLKNRNVKIFDKALSNRETELEFVEGVVSGVFGVKAHLSEAQIETSAHIVKTSRLDNQEIHGNSIVLKIDVEGHEREVLEGAEELFKANRIKALYLDGYKDKLLPDYLKSKGFLLFDGRTLKPVESPEYSLLAILEKYVRKKGEDKDQEWLKS